MQKDAQKRTTHAKYMMLKLHVKLANKTSQPA